MHILFKWVWLLCCLSAKIVSVDLFIASFQHRYLFPTPSTLDRIKAPSSLLCSLILILMEYIALAHMWVSCKHSGHWFQCRYFLKYYTENNDSHNQMLAGQKRPYGPIFMIMSESMEIRIPDDKSVSAKSFTISRSQNGGPSFS